MWSSERTPTLALCTTWLLLALTVLWPAGAKAEEIVVVTAARGGLTTLDRGTTEQLYLGRRSNLFDGQGVMLIDLPAGPVRDAFYQRLTRKNPSQIRAYWSRLVFTGRAQPPREASSVDEARRLVLESQGSIAYLPRTAANDPGLQILFILE